MRVVKPSLLFILFVLIFWPRMPRFGDESLREPASLLPVREDRAVHVVALNPDFPIDDLKRDGYRVDPGTLSGDEPDPKVRDEIFREVGAWPYAKKLDHLDRSFLFLRAREYSAVRFGARYSVLSSDSRRKLQKIAKSGEWAR